jgi:predicted phage terminase large subunit-like protein
VDLSFALHDAQMEVFTDPTRFKVVSAGRRFGKSYLSAVTLLVEGLKETNTYGYKLGPERVVYYVAPTFNQAKDIIWKMMKELGQGAIESTLENTGVIRLINGREIHIKGSDRPDSLRGVGLSYVVLDEYASMKPATWEEILRPTLTDVKAGALFIGTPAGKNHFYKLFKSAEKNPNLKSWSFESIDNPFLPKEEIEEARDTMSKAVFLQEYKASFSVQGGSTLNPELMKETSEPSEGSFYMAVDPAGYQEVAASARSAFSHLDECAVAVVKVSDRGWWVADIIHGRWGVRETALKILRTAQQYQPLSVGIEKGSLKNALMPYLQDYMAKLNTFPRIEEVTHGGQKKVERIVWALQGRLEHGRLTFNEDKDWEAVYEQMSDFPNPLAHDDLLDALAYIDQVGDAIYHQEVIIDDPYADILDEVAGF